jgi:hypothetical protein
VKLTLQLEQITVRVDVTYDLPTRLWVLSCEGVGYVEQTASTFDEAVERMAVRLQALTSGDQLKKTS